jgi:hypothetical protein
MLWGDGNGLLGCGGVGLGIRIQRAELTVPGGKGVLVGPDAVNLFCEVYPCVLALEGMSNLHRMVSGMYHLTVVSMKFYHI